jgi:hypothetical protein
MAIHKPILLIIVLTISTGNVFTQNSKQQKAMEKAKHGQYDEPGAQKNHPLTIFNQAHTEAILLSQIETIKNNISDPSYGVFKNIYRIMIYPTPFSGYSSAGDASEKSSSATNAKNAAFVYLLGFDTAGADIKGTAKHDTFKIDAIRMLMELNPEVGKGTTAHLWRSKDLLRYLQA